MAPSRRNWARVRETVSIVEPRWSAMSALAPPPGRPVRGTRRPTDPGQSGWGRGGLNALRTEPIGALPDAPTGARFLAEADPARLACLVLDQHLPKMAGLDLLAELRGRGVATPALLVVG